MNTHRTTSRQHTHGFTLIEQIAALAVSAVLVAMAVPAMADLVTRSAVETTRDALFTAARTARTAAITHNTDALLCPSRDGQHCIGEPTWQQGWIVALDKNHDGQPDASVLIHAVPDAHVVTLGSSGRDHVRFRADGAAVGTNLTLLLCPHDAGGGTAWVIIVSNSGRIREARAGKARQARCRDAQ